MVPSVRGSGALRKLLALKNYERGKKLCQLISRVLYSCSSVVAYRSSHDVIYVVVSEGAAVVSWTLDSHGWLEGSQGEPKDEDKGLPLEQHW